jgi:hypothetical protein
MKNASTTPSNGRPVVEPTRCLACFQAVELLRTAEHCLVIDRDDDGRPVPHACPKDAVKRFNLSMTVRRFDFLRKLEGRWNP